MKREEKNDNAKKKDLSKLDGIYTYFVTVAIVLRICWAMVVKEPEDSGVGPMRPAETGIIWNISKPVR